MPTATTAGPPQIAKLAKDGRERLLRHVRGEIAELEKEIGILRATERDLSGRAAPAARPRAGNGSRTASRRPARTRGAATTELHVFDAVKAGARQSSAIARKLGASSSTVLRHLRALEAQGKVKRTGSGRDMTWMPAG